MFAPLLDVEVSFFVAGARDCGPCQKCTKREGFVEFPKNNGRPGAFEEDLQRCIFCGRRSTKHMFIRAVTRSGQWFPEGSCILEHQIFRFAKMILRDRCSTLYDLASLFRGGRSNLDRWSAKIAKHIGTRPSALHPTFHFWRKSRRIASFSMLSNRKMRKSRRIVLFLMLPNRKMRKSRRLVSLLMLPSSKIEKVSQNCCVVDVVRFKSWGSLPELLRFQACR